MKKTTTLLIIKVLHSTYQKEGVQLTIYNLL